MLTIYLEKISNMCAFHNFLPFFLIYILHILIQRVKNQSMPLYAPRTTARMLPFGDMQLFTKMLNTLLGFGLFVFLYVVT